MVARLPCHWIWLASFLVFCTFVFFVKYTRSMAMSVWVSLCLSLRFPAFPNFSPFRSLPRLCSHQHHLHTINGLAPRSGLCCSRCSQKKWPELLRPIDTHKSPSNLVKTPEVTILSVGRWEQIENEIYTYVNAEKEGLYFRHQKSVSSFCFLNIENILHKIDAFPI